MLLKPYKKITHVALFSTCSSNISSRKHRLYSYRSKLLQFKLFPNPNTFHPETFNKSTVPRVSPARKSSRPPDAFKIKCPVAAVTPSIDPSTANRVTQQPTETRRTAFFPKGPKTKSHRNFAILLFFLLNPFQGPSASRVDAP